NLNLDKSSKISEKDAFAKAIGFKICKIKRLLILLQLRRTQRKCTSKIKMLAACVNEGKINKDELDSTCAAREVLEETGYDITPLIREQDYVELTIREQRIRLYIVVGVPEDTEFCPKTRKEISKVEWHKVSDLPTWIRSRDKDTPYHCGGGCVKYGSSRFYMVVPFV
ncbi:9060_t:CDS:2, partial [Racocetra persica]